MLNEPLDYYDYYVTEVTESSKVTWRVYRGHPESAWGFVDCTSRENAIGRALSLANVCRAAGRQPHVHLRERVTAPWLVLPIPSIAQAA